MKRKFNVEVKVNSFTPPRVYLGVERVELGNDSPRTGTHTMDVAGDTLQAKLRFTAPAKTAWSFKVKEERKGADGKVKETTLLDESGKSNSVDFEEPWPLKLTT
jgi:hypothetical protein